MSPTLATYNVNTQYTRTELEYQAKLTAVKDKGSIENKNKEENSEVENSPNALIYTSESDLTNVQQLRKQILEKILGGFTDENKESPLFPNDNLKMDKQSYETNNPYTNNNQNLPAGIFYSETTEYYEKTSFEFEGEIKIKTPSGEYNLELKFSFTKEFYEKNESQAALIANNAQSPFEINLDEDNDSLKDLGSLHLVFDVYKEDENQKDIFEQLKELLAKRNEALIELFKRNEDEDKSILPKGIDNFQIWQENSSEERSLLAIQKDGLGIFVASASNESSSFNLNVNANGYSMEANYSKSTSTYTQISQEIRA